MAVSHANITVQKHFDFNANTQPTGTTEVGSGITYSGGALNLNGNGYLSSSASGLGSTNFGIEAIVTFNSFNDLLSSGFTGVLGLDGDVLGIISRSPANTVSAHRGGVGDFGNTVATLGTEYHLALVRTGTTNSFYVNGVLTGTNGDTAGTPTTLTIGSFNGNGRLQGAINEVRTFTFTSGAFSTDDLLFQAPSPFKSVVDYGGGSVTDNGAVDPTASPAGNHGLDKVSDGVSADSSLYLTKTTSALGTSSPPSLIIDLGANRTLKSMALWSYLSTTSNNAVRDFGVKFATQAGGTASFGNSITYNPIFTASQLTNADRQVFNFSETVTARYVQVTFMSNHGGDRYGLSEIQFADVQVANGATLFTAISPTPVTASWWTNRHAAKLIEVQGKQENVDLLFVGDSITHFWSEKTDQPYGYLFEGGLSIWNQYYVNGVGNAGRKPVNLGYGGDTTENILWRLQHGEMQGIFPKVAVILAGTNNTGLRTAEPAAETAQGVQAIIREIRLRSPYTKILLHGITPRDSPTDGRRIKNNAINAILQTYNDNEFVFYLNLDSLFLNGNGTVNTALMPDNLHPNLAGYTVWAPAMEPTIDKLFGVIDSGVDLDADQIDDGWEILNFGNTITANASSDSDGDTHSDLNEFRFRTDPNNASIFAKLIWEGSSLKFRTVSGINYQLESSTNLSNWGNEGSVIAGDGTTITLMITTTNNPMFFRMKAL